MKHLEGMGYWKHFGKAMKWSYLLCVGGVLGFFHAIFPFVYPNIISNTVSGIKRELDAAIRKKRRGR